MNPLSRVSRGVRCRVANYLRHVICGLEIQTYDVKGCAIELHVGSEIEAYRASTYTTKEPETLEWIEQYIGPNDVFYDVGADIGLYSLFAAKWLGGQCKVYALEPEAMNYAQLSRNIFLNGLSGIVVPCCVAVTDGLCFDHFYLNPHNFETMVRGHSLVSGSALHSFGTPEDYRGEPFRSFHTQGVVGVSLDYLWQGWGLPFPNHVKIDVDGLEEKIVAGAELTLKDPRLKSILIEISGDAKGRSIIRTLLGAGFREVEEFANSPSSRSRALLMKAVRTTSSFDLPNMLDMAPVEGAYSAGYCGG